jgi:hypothetical protein
LEMGNSCRQFFSAPSLLNSPTTRAHQAVFRLGEEGGHMRPPSRLIAWEAGVVRFRTRGFFFAS